MIEVIVSRKRQEAVDIVSLELARADGGPLPEYTAGAHIDVHLPGNRVRQYSLCGPLGDRQRYQVAVLRDPASRGGSIALHDSVQEGDRLLISPPRNLFPLAPEARYSVLLAGGIGVTPILAMADQLNAEGKAFQFHYCARSRDRMAFHERLSGGSYAGKVRFHLDDGAPEQRLDLARDLPPPAADTHLYVCGPAGFIDHVLSTAKALGWSPEQLHREYFSADGVEAGPAEAFRVQIASTGEIFTIPEGRSVAEVLIEQGIDIPTSCEEGMCGSCLTGVISVEGQIQHNDIFLSDSQKAECRSFTPCCSRATAGSLLVLDL